MTYGLSISMYAQRYRRDLPEGVRPAELIGLEKAVADEIFWAGITNTKEGAVEPLVRQAFPNLRDDDLSNIAAVVKTAAHDIASPRVSFVQDLMRRFGETAHQAYIAYQGIQHPRR